MMDKRNVEPLQFVGIGKGSKENKIGLEHEKEARCEAGKEIHSVRTGHFNFSSVM